VRVRGSMGRMRVAFHTDQLWFSAPGGIGTYVRELLTALAASPDAPKLSTFQVGTEADRRDADVVVPGSIRTRYPGWDLIGRPGLPEALVSCDVVHATNHAAIPPAAPGQALVATVHDLAFDVFPDAFPTSWRWLYRAGVRAAARRADVVVTPSRSTANDVERRHGIDPARVCVTPLAASLRTTTTDPAATLAAYGIDPPFILCPATLEPRKNQVRLIRAYRQVAPDVPHALVLSGPDGWGTDDVDAELARGGSGRVIRTGLVTEGQMDAMLRAADLVAYPSLYEGFGLPVVEAMARGVPVLTSTAPAVAETAGEAALLVDPEDVAAIAEGLALVLTDRSLRDDLVAKGRARAAGFSWEATARATLDAYRDAMERARA
jgi:glycosyltransferase involved in cell wall biosynthesis